MNLTKELLDPYALALLGSDELVDIWWNSPNKSFMNERPIDADLELVKDYLRWHCFASVGS